MKYCILRDRPLCGLTAGSQEEALVGGCTIYGVAHECRKCPDCVEMGDEPTVYSTAKNDYEY